MKDFKPVAAALAVAAAVALPAGIAAAADSHAGRHANAGHSGDHKAKGFVCRGALASGTYKKLTVPDGASCHGKNATVTVRGGVTVGAGATFVLGSEKGTGGGTIGGGLDAKDAASVQLHFAHVDGGVSIVGGNGFFSTVEDNVIHGGATIDGYTGFWLGFIRNRVHGTVNLSNNTLDDPDANEFVSNTVRGNLVCHNNVPAPQVGDSGGSPNDVSGRKIDQCAVPGL